VVVAGGRRPGLLAGPNCQGIGKVTEEKKMIIAPAIAPNSIKPITSSLFICLVLCRYGPGRGAWGDREGAGATRLRGWCLGVFLGLNKMLSKIHRAVQARLEIKVSRAAGALANGVAAFAP
jgi:hypothetical protein